MVIGLRIGAANRKLTTSAGFNPRASKLRATGTLPHSQTGSASPANDNANRRQNGLRGKILVSLAGGKKRRIKDEMIIPRMTKGKVSMTMLNVMVRKSCNIVVVSLNQMSDLSLISHSPSWGLYKYITTINTGAIIQPVSILAVLISLFMFKLLTRFFAILINYSSKLVLY